jgi:DMSO/TMAO reductase YedYZ molybdopterin-dependent catalytic subunit
MQDRNKLQGEKVRTAASAGAGVIVSPDTQRSDRLPPNQARTRKWPVLDAHGPPSVDLASFRLGVSGLVKSELDFDWKEFQALPRVRVFADMHCVTRWSRLGNVWEGVAALEILKRAEPLPEARFVIAHGYDHGFTTNLPLYAWKSAKWLKRIELVSEDEPGFWERAGYHDVGDPWREERFR